MKFEPYIIKLLEKSGGEFDSDAVCQLDSVLFIIAAKMVEITLRLTDVSKKKTLSEKEIAGATNIIFKGEWRDSMLKAGSKAVEVFRSTFTIPNRVWVESAQGRTQATRRGGNEVIRRHERASITFPPFIAEKFLRNFGQSNIMLAADAPVFLAAILETLGTMIINRVSKFSVRNLALLAQTDDELSRVFNHLNIQFLGGGVAPFIHPLLDKNLIEAPLRLPSGRDGIDRLPAGESALQEIRRIQQTSNVLLAKLPFEKIVRGRLKQRASKNVFLVIQHVVEQEVIELLRKANLVAVHAGRLKMSSDDIQLVRSLGKSV